MVILREAVVLQIMKGLALTDTGQSKALLALSSEEDAERRTKREVCLPWDKVYALY